MEVKGLEQIKHSKDQKFIYCERYEIDAEHCFILEPNFISQLHYYEERKPDDYVRIINKLIEIVMKNKKVVFTADFENPVVYDDDFIYQEIEDITDPLEIFSGFISFGNEYGD